MSGTATTWPGQEVQQWPGQEVTASQGEHGYAPAPPEPKKSAEPVDEWGIPAPASDQTPGTSPGPRQLDAPSVEFHPFAPPKPGALGRVGQAAAEGWSGGQVASPNLIMAPVYNTLMGGLGAVFRGGQQFAQETIDPILPGLGRDIAAIPEAFPLGPKEAVAPRVAEPRNGLGPEMRPPGPAQTADVYPVPPPAPVLDPRGVPIVDFTPPRNTMADVERPLMPAEPQPKPASEPGPTQPTPAGAQITPASELGMTPREEAAYRSTAEGNKLLEPQEPGVRDNKQYLPGERVSEAEASQDVEVARELKSLRQQTPALDAQMTADENFNNNLRYNAINNAIPGQVQIGAAKTARENAMKTAEPKVFGNATDADVQPIVTDIQDILNDPKNRQNSQLQQYVKPLIDRLQNPDGTPKIVDPKELWSWRQDVQHLTSGAAQAADPNLSRVSGILGRVLDTTDNQIEAAAPGYKAQLRDEYRTRSREIDAMEALNAERFKLFDSQNKPNYNAVQGLMRRITDARQANDPYDAFTHVTQDTLDNLWNIRDSMRRSVASDRLAAPKGSPTTQNFGDAMRAAGRMALQTAAPAAGATLGSALIPIPGVGPAVGLTAGAMVNHLFSERALAQRFARGQELLNVPLQNAMGPAP